MMRRRVSVVAIAVASLVGPLLGPVAPAGAAGPTVTGAGSTWSQIAVDQWRSDVARFGLRVNYQGVGSSSGRQFYLIDQVDFAVSEIPFEPDELAKLAGKRKSFQYLPIVAGGTSLMYNLGGRVKDLKLSPRTIAAIFTGKITNWSDPAIAADNGRPLPAQNIIPVVRSDGSGTSAQFTAFMSKVTPDLWQPFAQAQGIGGGPTSNYPNFPGSVAQRGSDGVANYVANDSTGVGSITYVETGYAIQRGRPVASVRNASGAYTQPTSRNVSVALTQASLNSDRTQNLDRVYTFGDPRTYPISSYSYMITPTAGFPPDKGDILGKFMIFFACEGQQKAEVLGYSPLPPNLVQTVFDAVKALPGAPPPPPIQSCNNPTITDPGRSGVNAGDSGIGGRKAAGADKGSGPATAVTAPTAAADGAASQEALDAAAAEGVQDLGPADPKVALASLAGARPPSAFPLLVAALAVLALVFGPPALMQLRRARGTARVPTSR